jgi:hypothetical protein
MPELLRRPGACHVVRYDADPATDDPATDEE